MRPNASNCQLVTAPTVEPVTVAEVKAHLRIDGADDDAMLAIYLGAARERIEQDTRRALIKQKWIAYITGDFGMDLPTELPRPRLMTGETFLLEYRNTSDAWTAWASNTRQENREPALLWATALPTDLDEPLNESDAVWRATYWSGYGTTAATVPGPLRMAVMMLVAHLYERREVVISGATITEVPKALDWLMDPYRVPWEGSVK